jgi:hypothetical protein
MERSSCAFSVAPITEPVDVYNRIYINILTRVAPFVIQANFQAADYEGGRDSGQDILWRHRKLGTNTQMTIKYICTPSGPKSRTSAVYNNLYSYFVLARQHKCWNCKCISSPDIRQMADGKCRRYLAEATGPRPRKVMVF